ncbi:uncharacterized protein EKO05_0000702 [Ascochyta rabiei]|uniref:uncharacterized protein n=1 Tax=Didymella rabiei TaxID=5454 RepID=UPI00220D96BD|nr:uncharacterized protein EKO05_0000702 [Ascochyta rabiei]UPX10026.1 hypothetical protein EKO05_0000702 [Ascochyta rabiei]
MRLLYSIIGFLTLGIYALPTEPVGSSEPATYVPIPLEFGREYSKEELDHLRATFTIDNTTNQVDTGNHQLSKRAQHAKSTTLNSYWDCPTVGPLFRTQRATANIISASNLVATVQWYGNANIDSWSLPSQRLTGPTVARRSNVGKHSFCASYGHQICSFKLTSDWSVFVKWQFHVFSTTVAMDELTPSGHVLVETCIEVGSGGHCPSMQAATPCRLTTSSIVRNA